jgi:SAM-dependent methyltransferase
VKPSTLLSLWRNSDVRLLLLTNTLLRPFYRLCFLASASRHGLLAALGGGARTFESLATDFADDPRDHDALRAWLEVGCLVGDLKHEDGQYSVHGFFGRRLAQRGHDAIAAWVEEAATLHRRLLLDTPGLLKKGHRFTMADQDGELVARASRIVEPFVNEAVRATLSPEGPVRLLDVGCGSGIYMRTAAELNPQLTALGLEIHPAVAEQAHRNLKEWRLEERATVEVGDIRDREPDASYDVATLHNNIYYFAVEERTKLLAHMREFLRPGGRLLLTTGCQGGSVVTELINLWAAATDGCGRLPTPDEMDGQLREAGFETEPPLRLIPRESFYAFVGTRS